MMFNAIMWLIGILIIAVFAANEYCKYRTNEVEDYKKRYEDQKTINEELLNECLKRNEFKYDEFKYDKFDYDKFTYDKFDPDKRL